MRILLTTLLVLGSMILSPAQESQDKTPMPGAPAETSAVKVQKTESKSALISDDKGIGPIKNIKLGPVDSTMAAEGNTLFQKYCVTCHELDKKKLGPPLRDVTDRRLPEFIMNMILNTDQMQKKDPEVKKMIDQYQVYMSVLVLNEKQARELLEYLRMAKKRESER